MSWFAAYTLHGAKVHATPTAPLPPGSGCGFRRGRLALCGMRVFSHGPWYGFDLQKLEGERCHRCQARIDKTPPEKAP